MFEQIYADSVFYPTLAWNMLLARVLKIRNWWDAVDENVILGAYPFADDVPRLAEIGIGGVVNTCHEYRGPLEAYKQFEIEQLHIPTTDFTHPDFADLELAVEFMDQQIAAGRKVYVHCKAGRARSATVVACWLIKSQKLTAKQAQAAMTKSRPHVNPKIDQRPVVKQFEEKYLRKTGPDSK